MSNETPGEIDREELESTPIYGHKAIDGNAHCSYGIDTEIVSRKLDDAVVGSPLEHIEGEWFSEWDTIRESYIDNLPDEHDREQFDIDAVQVGVLYYSFEELVLDVEIFDPEKALDPEHEVYR